MSRLRAWDRLTLAAVPSAVCCARTFTKCTLRWWDATDVMDDALLIISELVTNAVKATGPNTPDPKWSDVKAEHVLGVQLRVVDMNLYVEVWDRAGEIPRPRHRQQTTRVDVASCWSSRSPEGGAPSARRRGGKIVWAELPLTKAPDLTPETPRSPTACRAKPAPPRPRKKTQVETALMERVRGHRRHLARDARLR
ncbi:ATP-binding protein [Streptomyces sp. NPDC088261]|uniref:ATP-binding protein n=1 Tax=Streptomyces sp. NPDC088261 TaxID=3365851 RepID=UPI0038154FC3